MACCKGTEVCDEKVCPFEGKPCDVVPTNTQILIERLTDQEMLGSKVIQVDVATSDDPPQGVVRAVGPKVDPAALGFAIGDRVIVVGNFCPTPKTGVRDKILVEPHQIKAVIKVA